MVTWCSFFGLWDWENSSLLRSIHEGVSKKTLLLVAEEVDPVLVDVFVLALLNQDEFAIGSA